jgi:hypothetical protein
MGVRGQPTKWDKWYSTDRWARIRRHQLLEHPLCKYCLERGIVTPVTICDHVEPHRGDVNKFWLGHNETSRGQADKTGFPAPVVRPAAMRLVRNS